MPKHIIDSGNQSISGDLTAQRLTVFGNISATALIEAISGLKVSSVRPVYIGPASDISTYSGLWINHNETTATTSNYTFLGDGASAYFNAPNANASLYFRTGNSTKMFIAGSTGNVGIGTSSPSTKLDVVGAAANGEYIMTIQNTTANGEFWRTLNSTGANVLSLGSDSNGHSYLDQSNNAGVLQNRITTGNNSYLNSGYNFGIGTNNPTSRFVVKSSGQDTTPFQIWYSTADTPILKVDQNNPNNGVVSIMTGGGIPVHRLRVVGDSFICDGSGNLGVGTSSPAFKLDVNGTLNATGNTTIGGTLVTTGKITANGQGALSALAANDVITLDLAHKNFGPIGKYEKNPSTIVLNNSTSVATGPLYGSRYDSDFTFQWGANVGDSAQIVFVPFFVSLPKTYTKAAIHIRGGQTSTYVLNGGIYLPDSNGFPKTLHGDVWSWDVSVTGKREANINIPQIDGLFYVALLPQIGTASWTVAAGTSLKALGVSQSFAGSEIQRLFNIVPQSFNLYDGPLGVSFSIGTSILPADLSSPEIRRLTLMGYNGVHPACILY